MYKNPLHPSSLRAGTWAGLPGRGSNKKKREGDHLGSCSSARRKSWAVVYLTGIHSVRRGRRRQPWRRSSSDSSNKKEAPREGPAGVLAEAYSERQKLFEEGRTWTSWWQQSQSPCSATTQTTQSPWPPSATWTAPSQQCVGWVWGGGGITGKLTKDFLRKSMTPASPGDVLYQGICISATHSSKESRGMISNRPGTPLRRPECYSPARPSTTCWAVKPHTARSREWAREPGQAPAQAPRFCPISIWLSPNTILHISLGLLPQK